MFKTKRGVKSVLNNVKKHRKDCESCQSQVVPGNSSLSFSGNGCSIIPKGEVFLEESYVMAMVMSGHQGCICEIDALISLNDEYAVSLSILEGI